MERRSFADIKAHLSEVVDQAEHRKKKILILRHGKPAAAIVPVAAVRARRARPTMSREEVGKKSSGASTSLPPSSAETKASPR